MEFSLTMLNFSDEQINQYLSDIKKSNLPKETRWEVTDLLKTAQIQIKEATDMGWLP